MSKKTFELPTNFNVFMALVFKLQKLVDNGGPVLVKASLSYLPSNTNSNL